MRQIALGLIVSGFLAAPTSAEEVGRTPLRLDGALRNVTFSAPVAAAAVQAAPAAEADPKVSAIIGVDFPSVYFFRGIRQEAKPTFTAQPFVDVAISASESTTINLGSWNSFHTGSAVSFYESDVYGSVSVSSGKITSKVLYTAYTSPDDGFKTVQELALAFAIDDSESTTPLAPSFTFAFELGDGQADAGANKGVYFEAGIAPGIPMADDAPVSVTIPVKIGMSLKDYYENPLTGKDSKFGYFSAGLTLGVPVNDMFEVHGGLTVFAFGDTLKFFNNDKAAQFLGSVGFSLSF